MRSAVCDSLHWHHVHVFRTRVRAYSRAAFGRGAFPSPIWLDEVRCVGSETRLVDCPANSFGDEDCSHSEDAGVSCDTALGRYERLLLNVAMIVFEEWNWSSHWLYQNQQHTKNTNNTDAQIYDGTLMTMLMMLITTPIGSVTIDINNNNPNYDT